jgi:hypothetical protein
MSYPGQRRPDAVIVKDPNLPPTQDNLKAVIEVKLPHDDWRGPTKYCPGDQEEDFERIAGSPKKVVLVRKEDCPCPDDVPKKKEEVEEKVKDQNRQTSFPWLKAVATGVAAAAVVAAAVALTPVEAVAAVGVGVAAGAAAVFGLFSSPSGSPDGA